MGQDILIVMFPKENPEQLCAKLEEHGLTTTLTQDLQTALEYLRQHISSFILIDLGIKGAIPFLETVLDTFYAPPPYILSADYFPCSMSQADILNLGVDRCLEKPLDFEEVIAVINAVLRRAERIARPGPLHAAPLLEHGGLIVDPLRRCVTMEGKPVSLTTREFDVLYLLVTHSEMTLSKAQIYEQVWNEDYQFSTTSVSDYISSIRKKLDLKARDNRYIQTIHGYGYRFSEPK